MEETTMACRPIGVLVILTLSFVLAPRAAEAQLPRTIPRIAYLSLSPGPCTTKGAKDCEGFVHGLRELGDTVGQPPSTEIGVLNMPSLKAKKLRKPPQEKVLLEL